MTYGMRINNMISIDCTLNCETLFLIKTAFIKVNAILLFICVYLTFPFVSLVEPHMNVQIELH